MPELVNIGNVKASSSGGGVALEVDPALVALLKGEVGSNANGEWVKLDNGLLICWSAPISLAYLNSTTLQAVWTFPQAFVASPGVAPNLRGWGTFVVGTPLALVAMDTATLQYRAASGSFASGATATFSATAVGRWK